MTTDDYAQLAIATPGVIVSDSRGRADRDRNAARPDARLQPSTTRY
jgi:hypothetical protein